MRIGIMGPQGSGKSTQAKLLADKLGLCILDTGQLIRDRAKEDDKTGKKLRELMGSGNLVGDQIPGELLQERTSKTDCQNGFIIDGYPRSLGQLEFFNPKFDKVIYLDISDEVAVERLSKRGREDDTPEGIKRRLEVFHNETKKIIEHYKKLGILIQIDANKSVEEVSENIEEQLQ